MKLVLLLAAAVAATPVAEDSSAPAVAEAGAERDAKLFSVFQIIKFNNDECPALDGSIGSCYTAAECTAKGGKDGGKCASGFGVCCISIVDPNCPADVITLTPSLIVNPGFPDTFQSDAVCAPEASNNRRRSNQQPRIFFPPAATTTTAAPDLVVAPADITTANPKDYTYRFGKISTDVVQMKIEFLVFDIAPPLNGDCSNETVKITGVDPVTAKFLPEALCGVLTGSHIYVSVKELAMDDTLKIVITLTGDREQKWQIRVSQIESSQTEKICPRGCLQYYSGDTANIMSFNYNDGAGEVINNLAYSICMDDTNDAYCSVAVMSNGDFDLKADATCGCTDFISFGGKAFCGSTFANPIWNQTGRYDMSVYTDGESPDMNGGFDLTLTKLPC